MIALKVAKGIISKEDAQSYDWLKSYKISNILDWFKIRKSNKFLNHYNDHQLYLHNKEEGKIFTYQNSMILPKFLVYANLVSAKMINADLRLADLSLADLRLADLSLADLRLADMTGADLSEAKITYADLNYADLSYADLTGADLSYAKIDADSLSLEIKTLDNITLKDTQLYVNGNLLGIKKSRKLIIEIMVERKITTANGLGDDYQKALIDADLITAPENSHSKNNSNEISNKPKTDGLSSSFKKEQDPNPVEPAVEPDNQMKPKNP